MTDIELLTILKRWTCRVVFAKADGTVRTIRGYALETDVIRTPGVVPIRDVETGAFKSFRVDSLMDIRRAPITTTDVGVVVAI